MSMNIIKLYYIAGIIAKNCLFFNNWWNKKFWFKTIFN